MNMEARAVKLAGPKKPRKVRKTAQKVDAGFQCFQALATRKCETLVYRARFLLPGAAGYVLVLF